MGNKSSSLPTGLEKEQLVNHTIARTGYSEANVKQKMKVFYKYSTDGKKFDEQRFEQMV